METLFQFYRSTIGKKILMALTGVVLYGFVVGHMIGNLKMFWGLDAGGVYFIDHYAEFLRAMGEDLFGHGVVLWIVRLVLLASVGLHALCAIQLTQLNKAARPEGYRDQQYRSATFASRYMAIGGIVLALFIVFHILHLTTGTLHGSFVEGAVYANVYAAFRNFFLVVVYAVAMVALGLHLYHGVWSMFQTLGIDSPRFNGGLRLLATVSAFGVTLGFVIVPLAVLFGLLGAPKSSGAGHHAATAPEATTAVAQVGQ